MGWSKLICINEIHVYGLVAAMRIFQTYDERPGHSPDVVAGTQIIILQKTNMIIYEVLISNYFYVLSTYLSTMYHEK